MIRWRIVFKMISSQPLILRIITVDIKTDENASEASDQDPTDALLIMPVTWQNLDSPSEIQRPQLNRNNSHPCVSSEPLIED